MLEEFHGIRNADNTATIEWKLLYNWGTLNANVWLPSLSELVGYTGTVHKERGTCLSAMQGLNTSIDWYVDIQGGSQFAYFKQWNASGGGDMIMAACNQEQSWLRSSAPWDAITAWRITNEQRFNTPPATNAHAVHPAGETIHAGEQQAVAC